MDDDYERDRRRVRQSVALALDPGAPDGEQIAAIKGILRIAKARAWKAAQLIQALADDPPREEAPPFGWDVVMPFGMHKGMTLGEIATSFPGYIEWLADQKLRSAALTTAVEMVHDWILRG